MKRVLLLPVLLISLAGCSRGGDDHRETMAEQEQAVRTLRAAEQETARQKLGDRGHDLIRIPEGEPPTSIPVQPPPEGENTIGEPLLGPPYSPAPPPR